MRREAPAFEKLKMPLIETRGAGFWKMETSGFEERSTDLAKIQNRFLEAWSAGFWKNWNRRRRYSGAKRRFWKIWYRHRRFWKTTPERRRRHWGVKCRFLKNWKCHFLKRVAPAFEIWKLPVLRYAALALEKFKPRFWGVKRRLWKNWNRRRQNSGVKHRLLKKNTDRRRRHWGVKRRLLKNWKCSVLKCVAPTFLNKMETPDIEILNAGFGKIETPFSRLRRLLKS